MQNCQGGVENPSEEGDEVRRDDWDTAGELIVCGRWQIVADKLDRAYRRRGITGKSLGHEWRGVVGLHSAVQNRGGGGGSWNPCR